MGLSNGHPNGVPSFMDSIRAFEMGDERGLLDKIDKLRALGVDQYVHLPQFVVVGDQSSGKSSVLERLTGIPFPRSGNRCTRFATEIIIRRATRESHLIEIVPSKENSNITSSQIADFRKHASQITDFVQLMEYAIKIMCSRNAPGQFFSKDILRVEVNSPKHSHLTIVDLPGLIQTSSMHQSDDDVEAIAAIVQSYMVNPRTIVLAVISGAHDYANQGVLRRAKGIDPKGNRTLGIITKPDKIDPDSADDFIQLALNQDTGLSLALGWHVLRNRGSAEMDLSAEEIAREEMEFFAKGPWRTLPRNIVGIDNLRPRLSTQLQHHIRKNVPDVEQEILGQLNDCRLQLEKLGKGKDTIDEMKSDMKARCAQSRKLTELAVDGHYKNPVNLPFFPIKAEKERPPDQNLRALVDLKTKLFVQSMIKSGHSVQLSDEDSETDPDKAQLDRFPGPPATPRNAKGRRITTRAVYIRDEVKPLLRDNVGEEFIGDPNPLTVYKLFQQYSANWRTYAELHVNEVQKVCNQFLEKVVAFSWEAYMQQRFKMELLEDQLRARLDRANSEAQRIFEDRERYIKSYDPNYVRRMDDWKKIRSEKGGGRWTSEDEAHEVLKEMLVYYDLTVKTFIDNIIVQVVERHMLHDFGSIFEFDVNALDEKQIVRIAQEDEQRRHERLSVRERKRVLEQGLSICREIDFGSWPEPEPYSPLQASPRASSPTEDSEDPLPPAPEDSPPRQFQESGKFAGSDDIPRSFAGHRPPPSPPRPVTPPFQTPSPSPRAHSPAFHFPSLAEDKISPTRQSSHIQSPAPSLPARTPPSPPFKDVASSSGTSTVAGPNHPDPKVRDGPHDPQMPSKSSEAISPAAEALSHARPGRPDIPSTNTMRTDEGVRLPYLSPEEELERAHNREMERDTEAVFSSLKTAQEQRKKAVREKAKLEEQWQRERKLEQERLEEERRILERKQAQEAEEERLRVEQEAEGRRLLAEQAAEERRLRIEQEEAEKRRLRMEQREAEERRLRMEQEEAEERKLQLARQAERMQRLADQERAEGIRRAEQEQEGRLRQRGSQYYGTSQISATYLTHEHHQQHQQHQQQQRPTSQHAYTQQQWQSPQGQSNRRQDFTSPYTPTPPPTPSYLTEPPRSQEDGHRRLTKEKKSGFFGTRNKK